MTRMRTTPGRRGSASAGAYRAYSTMVASGLRATACSLANASLLSLALFGCHDDRWRETVADPSGPGNLESGRYAFAGSLELDSTPILDIVTCGTAATFVLTERAQWLVSSETGVSHRLLAPRPHGVSRLRCGNDGSVLLGLGTVLHRLAPIGDHYRWEELSAPLDLTAVVTMGPCMLGLQRSTGQILLAPTGTESCVTPPALRMPEDEGAALTLLPGPNVLLVSRYREGGIRVLPPSGDGRWERLAFGPEDDPGRVDEIIPSHDGRSAYLAVVDGRPGGIVRLSWDSGGRARTTRRLDDALPQRLALSARGDLLAVTTRDRAPGIRSRNLLLDPNSLRTIQEIPRIAPAGVGLFDGAIAFGLGDRVLYIASGSRLLTYHPTTTKEPDR